VGWNWEKIISEGGGFRSEVVRSGGQRHKREGERDRHKMELLLSRVGATNLGRPYKLGIYTPKLGHTPFRHITNMTRTLMDSVNTAIRCPYSIVHPCYRSNGPHPTEKSWSIIRNRQTFYTIASELVSSHTSSSKTDIRDVHGLVTQSLVVAPYILLALPKKS
jgi:hypothetical protein